MKTDPIELLLDRSKEAAKRSQQALGKLCDPCRYKIMCGGGCIKMRRNVCYSETDTACGMKAFLDETVSELTAIAMQQIGLHNR